MKVMKIISSTLMQLNNPLLKAHLQFLQFIVSSINRFNRLFHKSTENTTVQLYNETSCLTHLYVSNFVKLEVIQDTADDLTTLFLIDENLLENEEELQESNYVFTSGINVLTFLPVLFTCFAFEFSFG